METQINRQALDRRHFICTGTTRQMGRKIDKPPSESANAERPAKIRCNRIQVLLVYLARESFCCVHHCVPNHLFKSSVPTVAFVLYVYLHIICFYTFSI